MKQKHTAWLGFLLGAVTVLLTTFGHRLADSARFDGQDNDRDGDQRSRRHRNNK